MFVSFLKSSLEEEDDYVLIIYTKKLLNSDWLGKECSFPVTRVQITNGFWLAENTKETTKNQSD